MCGIALIISGIKIDLSSLIPNYSHVSPQIPIQVQYKLIEDEIITALKRRGPDSLGTKSVFLDSKISALETESFVLESVVESKRSSGIGELRFIGSTLQLRGFSSVVQPLTDAFGNVLVYNGEIFGGINVESESNDTEILMQSLGDCCSCISHEESGSSCCSGGIQNMSVPELLSRIKGPWALIYWQDSSKTLWFGRDAFGRRSLVVHWPSFHDSRLLLSSVSPSTSLCQLEKKDENGMTEVNFWEELPCGIYSISLERDGLMSSSIRKHGWLDAELLKLITWERTSIQPESEQETVSRKVSITQQEIFSSFSSGLESFQNTACETPYKVLMALKESVMRRTISNRFSKDLPTDHRHRREKCAPIAVMFSGGLDSMIIAALLHQCTDPESEIDLLNVSFDGESAPDRISARAGLKELKKNAVSRRWNLVEIDADLHNLVSETQHVMSLINPAKTYMDLNIGIALWLASGGDGFLYEAKNGTDNSECQRLKYKSKARILLVGSGADEQCAGYGRHRTKFRNGSWVKLHEEMKLDMQRIWKRNLGRDDRCIADNGKEARFPFLDEDVIRILLDIPLWDIADLDQPSGVGDKKILRDVARLLNLGEAAVLPKRAIQFGSRIARESNRIVFGSNRAANQASAGSVVIHGPSI